MLDDVRVPEAMRLGQVRGRGQRHCGALRNGCGPGWGVVVAGGHAGARTWCGRPKCWGRRVGKQGRAWSSKALGKHLQESTKHGRGAARSARSKRWLLPATSLALAAQEGDGFKIAMAALDGGRINIGACRCAVLPDAQGSALVAQRLPFPMAVGRVEGSTSWPLRVHFVQSERGKSSDPADCRVRLSCLGARSVGGAQLCLDTAREYTRARQQFGGPISAFQATQFRVADMATSIQASGQGRQSRHCTGVVWAGRRARAAAAGTSAEQACPGLPRPPAAAVCPALEAPGTAGQVASFRSNHPRCPRRAAAPAGLAPDGAPRRRRPGCPLPLRHPGVRHGQALCHRRLLRRDQRCAAAAGRLRVRAAGVAHA